LANGFFQNGWVSPKNMKWHSNYSQKIKELTETKIDEVLTNIDDIYARLYKEHPSKIAKKSEESSKSSLTTTTSE